MVDWKNNGIITLEENNDPTNLRCLIDLVVDEYGNYYHIIGFSQRENEYLKYTLSQFYYEDSYAILFDKDIAKEYQHEYIGETLRARLNNSIIRLNDSKRTIFSIQDLTALNIELEFKDITKDHSRNKK